MFIAFLFSSHSPCLARADIIVLDYIVKGKLISKLEENERVSLIFSTNRKSVTREEVSNGYNHFNPWLKHIKVVLYGSSHRRNECLNDVFQKFKSYSI